MMLERRCLVIDSRVSAAIADVFDVDPGELTAESNPDTIPDWDSVGHFKLILHLEEVFGVRIPANEIGGLTTAGKIEAALARLGTLR
jgi:acyl carrier protein